MKETITSKNENYSGCDEVKDKINEDDFNLEYLIHLKNKIHIKNENTDENQTDNSEEKQFKLKCKILIFFKKLISNLEIINEYIKVLRTKGNSLPIKITIKTKIKDYQPFVEYYLDGKKNNFIFIKDLLFRANLLNKNE